MMGGYGGGWWLLMWAWMAVFWLLVIVGIVWLVWLIQRPVRGSSEAEEILKQRLARGEIDPDQYRALAREVGSDSRSSPRGPGGGQILLVLFVVLAVAAFFGTPAFAATRGDWNMFDHMGRMMGGGRNSSNDPLSVGGPVETVTISDFAFSPGNLLVPVGATVTWTNRDSAAHDATSRDGSWETETLSQGESGPVTFYRAGEYDYYCSIHPSMKAHVSVE